MSAPAGDHALDVQSVVDWLVEGAPGVTLPEEVLRQLAERLVTCGVALSRGAVFVSTLHPNVMGRGFYWRAGEREVRVAEAPHSILESDLFLKSPVQVVLGTGEEVRRRISDPACPRDFPLLDELSEDGATDYVAMPLRFTNGDVHAVSWCTRREPGFDAAEVAALRRVRPALARLAECYAHRRTAVNLLDAYLGRQSGEKVLRGQIRRGDGEDIHAVIWFCDLRGSTPLADSMGRRDFLGVLNQYFERMGGAVLERGGEVLRFIGDAMLGIFPVSTATSSTADACERAVAAAQDAMSRMEALNALRVGDGHARLEYGIGLHRGDVIYGNVGTPERIEFTVIGAAANEAARIESLCKVLGSRVLASADVVAHAPGVWHPLGRHALRGVGAEIEVFTPAFARDAR